MDFKDKYSTKAGEKYIYFDNLTGQQVIIDKKVVSDDAFAIGEMLQNLINELARSR